MPFGSYTLLPVDNCTYHVLPKDYSLLHGIAYVLPTYSYRLCDSYTCYTYST